MSGKVIAITYVKGVVGKTTITANVRFNLRIKRANWLLINI